MASPENSTAVGDTLNSTNSLLLNFARDNEESEWYPDYCNTFSVVYLPLCALNLCLTVTINPLCLMVIQRTPNVKTCAKMYLASLIISDFGMGILGFVLVNPCVDSYAEMMVYRIVWWLFFV